MTNMMINATIPDFKENPRFLSASETAKVLRKALKNAFPKIKFSVRSKTYSGGASIHFDWTDGPTSETVRKVSDGFAGGGFDGSIDLAYSVTSWMMPNGSIIAHSEGTIGSYGTHFAISNNAPHSSAILVHFGADYVFPKREYSDGVYAAAVAEIQAKRSDGTLEESLDFSLRCWVNDDRILALNALANMTL